MASTTHLMTVEEFRQLSDDTGPVYYELRHGEVCSVVRPKLKHFRIQRRLRTLLEPLAKGSGIVDVEIAFRPVPEHEFRIADVAYLSAERYEQADDNDNIRGAPELVIEVLSPSNTAAEMYDKQQICLTNGSLEFWVVNPARQQIYVTTADGHAATYQSDDEIPVPFGVRAKLKVADIFRYRNR
jgi:Uma2 family endonuclease